MVEVVHFAHMRAQAMINVFHWRLAAGSVDIPDSSLAVLLTQKATDYNTLATVSHVDWTYTHSVARVITGKTNVNVTAGTGRLVYGLLLEQFAVPPIPGLMNFPSLPTYAAARLILRTDRAGRRFRGSKRIGGLIEDATDGDVLTGAAQTGYQAFADLYKTAVPVPGFASTFELCVFSKKHFFQNPAITSPGSFGGTVTAMTCRPAVGTQNTRKQPATGVNIS